MEPCRLRKLIESDESEFFSAMANWPREEEYPLALAYQSGKSISEYLARLSEYENGINLPSTLVPMTMLWGFVGDRLAGRSSLRHRLNENLLESGGHIGYAVLPEFRGRGIATSMLRQTLPVAKQLGLSRVLLTCDDDNNASIRTIEKCGGRLENIIEIRAGDKTIKERRYWIVI